MKLIIGLGNIGEKYCLTRHNIGFMVVDKLAIDNSINFKLENKFKSYVGKGKIANDDVLLIKPTTFMNLSGDAVQLIVNYYKIDISDILIVFDDLSIDLGIIRFKADGSHGGHNGIKSIIKCFNSNKFARLKVGIGPQPQIPAENFVLQNFPKEQLNELSSVIKLSCEAIGFYLLNGMAKTQNKYN